MSQLLTAFKIQIMFEMAFVLTDTENINKITFLTTEYLHCVFTLFGYFCF